MNAEEGGGEIGIEDGVPVGALHAHDELVARDAGIVDEDVDLAEAGDRRFDGGLHLVFVGDVHGEGGGFAAGGADRGGEFFQLLLIARRYGNAGSLTREVERAGVADALRGSGD